MPTARVPNYEIFRKFWPGRATQNTEDLLGKKFVTAASGSSHFDRKPRVRDVFRKSVLRVIELMIYNPSALFLWQYEHNRNSIRTRAQIYIHTMRMRKCTLRPPSARPRSTPPRGGRAPCRRPHRCRHRCHRHVRRLRHEHHCWRFHVRGQNGRR